MKIKQFDIHIATLDPVVGSEMSKTRPVVILSNDAMNDMVQTVIVAPLTHTLTDYPFRMDVEFQGQSGEIALDHIRSISKKRLKTRAGRLDVDEIADLKTMLRNIFSKA
jgi:mRNA interferase MazF